MNLPFIIVIRAGVVDTAEVSTRENCEKHFLDKCASCLTNWDEYTSDDITDILDDGYAEFGGNGSSVCLTWIDEIPSEPCPKCNMLNVATAMINGDPIPQIFIDKAGLASIV